MSKRAEERALEIYPIPKRKNFIRLVDFASAVKEADKNRINFIKGYKVAQKDLGWKSVDEELPKKSGKYFVHIFEWGYEESYWDFDTKKWRSFGVDYWMPIPELPKEK